MSGQEVPGSVPGRLHIAEVGLKPGDLGKAGEHARRVHELEDLEERSLLELAGLLQVGDRKGFVEILKPVGRRLSDLGAYGGHARVSEGGQAVDWKIDVSGAAVEREAPRKSFKSLCEKIGPVLAEEIMDLQALRDGVLLGEGGRIEGV